MTQLDVKRSYDEKTILRDVLNAIATNREPGNSVPPVLEAVRLVTGSAGVAFFLFNEPRLFVGLDIEEAALPLEESLGTWVGGFQAGIYANPTPPEGYTPSHAGWMLAPIRVGERVVGMLWLVFEIPRELSNDEQTLLMSLVDGLTIVSTHARSRARHEKISRNQYEFTRIVSHDLRSPLTSMKGFASMLETNTVGDLNERQAHFVEKILSGISQMTTLVENIQDAGRYDPETGFYEMQRSPCDLTEITQRIVGQHLVPAEKQELTISVDAADDVPILNADSNMLERALTNLMDNAIKYTPNGGKIVVVLKKKGEQILLSVKDDGYGISPEHQKTLFQRGARIQRREHKRVRGSGLGLFIVRSVAQRHEGNAWVESTEGEGSTFFMSIPLTGENLVAAGESGE